MEDTVEPGGGHKQAAIVIYEKNKWLMRLMNAWAAATIIIGYALTGIPLFALMGGVVTIITGLRVKGAVAKKQLEWQLRENGYEVSMYRNNQGERWSSIFEALNQNAGPETTTLLVYMGHGDKNEYGSSIFLENSVIRDDNFLWQFNSIPGKKVAAISSCQAGGFAENARQHDGNGELLVFTSSDDKIQRSYGPFLSVLRRALRSNNSAYNEFSHPGRMLRLKAPVTGYKPQVFCGSKMRTVRL